MPKKKATPRKKVPAKKRSGGGKPRGKGKRGGQNAGDNGQGTLALDDPSLPKVSDMYGDWFLDYASYVILERAVPHINDGLKPVQRRILHSLKELDDGRYNKVANVVGNTMKYHPHGDASIADAMVQLGQKDLVIDTQGNWGNILTGDPAAAPRYIEARVSKLANEILFNPKTTTWALSYDGRNKEPVTLPVKFPLLLAQGVEGIAVGLSCKILPHNFNELIDACIDALRKKPFELFPDFIQGGLMDASEYNEGLRGGRIRVRARIEMVKAKLLRITEIPFGTTTGSLMDSIVAANEKGKLKISKIEDNTASAVEILIHLPAGVSADQIEQALYAFTDCEVSISPNSCVIDDNRPKFLPVSKILKYSAEFTKALLQQELEIRLAELQEKWHFSSLEKIFIEKRIYRDIEECTTWEAVIEAIRKGLKPYVKKLKRAVTTEDIVRLTEIKIKRISKYDSFKADEILKNLEGDIAETKKNLSQITRYAVRYFKELKEKYGKGRERRTEVTTFGRVVAAKVAVATETLYVNRREGFVGYGIKREESVGKCSRMDDVITICRDGTMKITKVADKAFIGKWPMEVSVFNKEKPRIYCMVYRDGREGRTYVKKFRVKGVTRDKLYELTRGTKGSRVWWLSSHDVKEKEFPKVRIYMKPALRLRNLTIDFDFNELEEKGRAVKGNIAARGAVDRVVRAPKEEWDE